MVENFYIPAKNGLLRKLRECITIAVGIQRSTRKEQFKRYFHGIEEPGSQECGKVLVGGPGGERKK